MNGWLLLGLIAALLATSYCSALNLALVLSSRSALERRLSESGRLGRRGWVLDRLENAGHAVALVRTAGRVMCFALVLVSFAGFGEGARITAGTLAATVVTSVLLIWLFTSVISAAVARYVSVALIDASIPFIRVVCVLAAPLLVMVSFVDEAVRRLAGVETTSGVEAEEDLLLTIEDSRKEGELDPLSARILENVVEFRSTTVSSVMTPRTNIVGLEYTDDLDLVRAFLAEAGHSRIPVFEESLDAIIGVLYVKDLVRFLGAEPPSFALRPLLRAPIRVPEMKAVRELLLDFQHSEVHMAIVVDEYGGTSGLVTIEDVLEEIVGEINDEHDADGDEAPELRPLGEGRWEVPGRYRVDDLNATLGCAIPDGDDYDTVGGFLLKRFGRIPSGGETLLVDGCTIEVASATPTHIVSVRLKTPRDAAETSGDGLDAVSEDVDR